jgi:uncharacterized protein (TIGR04168 family)
MHHRLKRGQGERRSFHRDGAGTVYLNTACVPRHGVDGQGRELRHLSWVTLRRGDRPGAPAGLARVSHRWYGPAGELHYEETLWRGAAAEVGGRC